MATVAPEASGPPPVNVDSAPAAQPPPPDAKTTNQAERKERAGFAQRLNQFCDYTSIVGFRLLRSENPQWLR